MKRIIILITSKFVYKVLYTFIIVIFAGCSFCFFSHISFNSLRTLEPLQVQDNDTIGGLRNENEKLKGILGSIFPQDQKLIYEKSFWRYGDNTPSFQTEPIQKIIENGDTLNFVVEYKNSGYLRPLYNTYWKDTYYRGWLYLPQKIEEARHKLFTYYGGLSNIYDFEGSLGFSETVPFDYHVNINFLLYHFNVKTIKMLEHQIVLIGEPHRTGSQVVAVKVKDILPQGIDTKEFLFQLSTPQGYEIDYEYGSYARSEYLKKLEKEGLAQKAFNTSEDAELLKQLKKENMLLKQELSKYIPLEEKNITEEYCRLNGFAGVSQPILDIKTARKEGTRITYRTHYLNNQYKRPVYDPLWKQNANLGWSYIPTKVCENLHSIFIIPSDASKKADFFGNLSFHEKYQIIKNNEIGFLIYNLTVKEFIKYNNQFIICGEPSRTGAEIISIHKENLLAGKKYLVQLITPDNYELDHVTIE